MAAEQKKSSGHPIHGISLVSFLQVLEQEKKTCTIIVEWGGKAGKLYFCDGRLVDAESDNKNALEAAYDILSWHAPVFVIDHYEERLVKISRSLAHIIVTATIMKDERGGATQKTPQPQQTGKPSIDAILARISKRLTAIAGVQHYFILDRQGKTIVQSMKNAHIGDFIAYCMMGGTQMRDVLSAKGLHNIRINLEDGHMLLIVPTNSITIALLLSPNVALSEVYKGLRHALSTT